MADPTLEESWKSPRVRRTVEAATASFSKILNPDERYDVGLDALRRCLDSYEEAWGRDFHRSLAQFVRWDCISASKKKRRRAVPVPVELAEARESRGVPSVDDVHVRECLGLMGGADREIIEQAYFLGMSLREIGRAQGCSHETARVRLDGALDRFSEIFLEKGV